MAAAEAKLDVRGEGIFEGSKNRLMTQDAQDDNFGCREASGLMYLKGSSGVMRVFSLFNAVGRKTWRRSFGTNGIMAELERE